MKLKQRLPREEWLAVPRENGIARQMAAIGRRSDKISSGLGVPCLIMAGDNGIGKSHTILQNTGPDAIRLSPKDYRDVAAAIDASGGTRPVILEEASWMFTSLRAINILKKATDRAGPAFELKRIPPEEPGLPPTWVKTYVKCPLFISVKTDLAEWEAEARYKMVRGDLRALFERVRPDVIHATPAEKMEYALYLALCHGMLDRVRGEVHARISLDVQNRAIQFFVENADHLRDHSPRTLTQIAEHLFDNRRHERVVTKRGRPFDLDAANSAQVAVHDLTIHDKGC